MPLVIVPTPIGNLGDITRRAEDALRTADAIACEDTRRTLGLIRHLGIKKPLISYHRHNERERAPELARRLEEGQTIALVSDAGTPGISDPGHEIIAAAIGLGVEISALPGPTAFVPALLLSGMDARRFAFFGFVDGSAKAKLETLKSASSLRCTTIFYISPHDFTRDISLFAETFGEGRRASLSREITKLHEETIRATLGELCRLEEARGELVLVIEGAPEEERDDSEWTDSAREMISSGAFDKDIVDAIFDRFGTPKNKIKKFILSNKELH